MIPSRNGFTLIELLVSMSILAILVGLLIVAIPAALFAAKRAGTGQRLQNILSAIQLYGQNSGQQPYLIMRHAMRTPLIKPDGSVDPVETMPDDLRWQPLRSVVTSVWGSQSSAPMIASRKTLIPNLAFTQEVASTPYRFSSDDWVWLMDALAPPAVANKLASLQTLSLSQIGENLDITQEVQPISVSGTPYVAWFRSRWPRAWPASDWDLPIPGRFPVRWDSPWGRGAIDPVTLIQTVPSARTLAELSPLDSLRLLQVAGVLPAGATGEKIYRQDRSPNKPWNDRWGQPLVVVSAVFVPPRSEVCVLAVNKRLGWSSADRDLGIYRLTKILGVMSTAKGDFDESAGWKYASGTPRDELLSRYARGAGFNRAVYVAVGAAGPDLTNPLPATWTAAEDPVALRNLWLQVRDVCRADEWTEKAFMKPPWNGYRSASKGRLRCQLSAPIEIK